MTNISNYKSKLYEDGFTVYKNAIDTTLCTQFINNIDNPNVHWNIRKCVKPIFADLWFTYDLLTSFDGYLVREFGEDDDGLLWHVDQNLSREKNKMVGIQAILALSNVTKQSGGTEFLPRSHRHHEAFVLRNDDEPYHDNTWEFITTTESDYIFKQCLDPIFPNLNIGDLLIWDSRTLHRVLPPLDHKNTNRIAFYLSMMPKKNATQTVLELRKNAFYNGLHTTHWCDRCITRGDYETFKLPIIDDSILNMVY